MSQVVPHQHGAWAFLALPVALAAVRVDWHPVLVPLVVAWIGAYPLAWAVTGSLAAPRPERFRGALSIWGPPTVLAGVGALAWRPWLLLVALAYLGGFAVSLRYARARAERARGHDLVLISQCTLMVPVLVAGGAEGGWCPPVHRVDAATWVLTAACGAALLGSTLHVKSLIRERRDPRYARGSRIFALACVPAAWLAAGWYDGTARWLLVVPFAAMAVRAFVVVGPSWRPARVGIVELGLLILLALSAALA